MKELDGREVRRIFEIAAKDDLMPLRARRRNNVGKRVGIDRDGRVRCHGLHQLLVLAGSGQNAIELGQPATL